MAVVVFADRSAAMATAKAWAAHADVAHGRERVVVLAKLDLKHGGG